MRGRASVGRAPFGDARRGSLLAMRPVHAGEGERGERESAGDETCPMRGRVRVGRGESAGDETCPTRGRAGVGRGSLLVVRPVHAGEGGRGERGW